MNICFEIYVQFLKIQILVFYEQNRKTRNPKENRAKKKIHKLKSGGAVFFSWWYVSRTRSGKQAKKANVMCCPGWFVLLQVVREGAGLNPAEGIHFLQLKLKKRKWAEPMREGCSPGIIRSYSVYTFYVGK